jgi:hypothetical protein
MYYIDLSIFAGYMLLMLGGTPSCIKIKIKMIFMWAAEILGVGILDHSIVAPDMGDGFFVGLGELCFFLWFFL